MKETPGWIQALFKRGRARHALHTAFLLNLTNEDIAEQAEAHTGGYEQLRLSSLDAMALDDPQTIALALVFLGVVGEPCDLPRVEPLVDHQSDLVRRAARTCRFELRQANRG